MLHSKSCKPKLVLLGRFCAPKLISTSLQLGPIEWSTLDIIHRKVWCNQSKVPYCDLDFATSTIFLNHDQTDRSFGNLSNGMPDFTHDWIYLYTVSLLALLSSICFCITLHLLKFQNNSWRWDSNPNCSVYGKCHHMQAVFVP